MSTIAATNSLFEIDAELDSLLDEIAEQAEQKAERDLELRGQGDLLGTRQSGMPGYRLAVPDAHRHLLELAHEDAHAMFASNPGLTGTQGEALRTLLYLFRKDQAVQLIRAG